MTNYKIYILSGLLAMLFITGLSPNIVNARGYSQRDLNDQAVLSMLWMKSAEYKGLCYQAYNILERRIAEERQLQHDRTLAIVFDCDETILNNLPYEAHFLDTNKSIDWEGWMNWCRLAQSDAIPGAVECIKRAYDNDIEVFYVANRQQVDGIEYVIDNLKKLGLPYADESHVLLPSEDFDKTGRFERIENEFEVIAYVGDNIADFPIGARGKTPKERVELSDVYREEFGKKFICLPNSMYGEWEHGLIRGMKNITPKEINKIRKEALKD